jgi:hypothetical protein
MYGTAIDHCIEYAVALKSIEIEHQRRDDWRARELNAARFLHMSEKRQTATSSACCD